MQRNRNNKWTAEEEEALLAGIAKHGFGKWANILGDPKFAAQLLDRTNVNLKDKWRNMQNRVKTVKSSSIFISPAKTCPVVVSNEPSPDISNDNRYNAMVFEAISTINDEKGSDLSEILSFIEEQHEVPQNFKKLLSYSLRILVSQDKLKKVQQHRYKISVTKAIKPTLTLRPKDSTKLPELPSTSVILTTSKETQEIEAAANKVAERINELAEENRVWHEEREDFRMFLSECLTILVSQGKLEKVLDHYKISELENKVLEAAPEVVAMKLAESDKKRLIAGEALEEEERMNKLVEESQTMLELCLEIQEQCNLKKPTWHMNSSLS